MTAIADALVGCRKCNRTADKRNGTYHCAKCGRSWQTEGKIVYDREISKQSVFDELYEQMQAGNQDEQVWKFCYEQQVNLAHRMLPRGGVVLDVGCGPTLAYDKPSDAAVIGVDPSLPSLRANTALDLAIWGTAANLPLLTSSVDVAFCFYSIHHMVGNTQRESTAIVSNVFRELGRVVKPGGSICVFDMSPWYPAWIFQLVSWNHLKRVLGDKLDMYFWRESALIRLADAALSTATGRTLSFATDPFITFPPIFNLPWLRVPRFMYPMAPKMYTWKLRE